MQGAPLAYVENQGPAAVDSTLTVTDPDSLDLVGATVAITAGLAAQRRARLREPERHHRLV